MPSMQERSKKTRIDLLVDESDESREAAELLYSLDRKIEIEGFPASGHRIPIAFWNGFSYRGLREIRKLKENLDHALEEGRI